MQVLIQPIISRFSSLVLALSFLAATLDAGDWLWVEGESALTRSVTSNRWYQEVPAAAFSDQAALQHFSENQPGQATFRITAPVPGHYTLWLRANPHDTSIRLRLNDAPWIDLPTTNAHQVFPLAGWDLRFLAWLDAGEVVLRPGKNSLEFELSGKPKPHGILDCFVLTRSEFVPFGTAKPDAAPALRAALAADATHWFNFRPPDDASLAGGPLDLRHLNEPRAGANGRILARDGQFIHEKSGQPVRFWAVNGPPHDLDRDALKACARNLAAHGVNLVRAHGAVFDEKTGALIPAKVRRLADVVDAMKSEGIYTHLSIYFPLWMRPQSGLPWLEGYDGTRHPFAALMFNEEFQSHYEGWWRAVLATPLADGTLLAAEPALLGVEIQNEDSFFFWTFTEANLPDPQLRRLERQFGNWLSIKYGSLAAAFTAWDSPPLPRDRASEGRAAFRPLWEIFNRKTPRDRDTAAFLLDTQTRFYQRIVRFLRNQGYAGLVTCSNWATASPEVFGPLEKLSYATGDFIDRHGYFGCRHGGLFSEWSLRDQHTFVNRSALRFDPENPGDPKAFNHPVIDIEYNRKPSMISETTWTRPNRYRPEAPLFLALYGALQESDAIVHFALDGSRYRVKPQFWMQPWTLMAPSQMAQFPAAALIFRRSLIAPGDVLADLTLGTEDLRNLQGTPLPQDAAFDELRLKDVPSGTTLAPGQRIDPLIHFAGRTRVQFADRAAPPRLADLGKLVRRDLQTVTSSTEELTLDYGKGLLTVNAPAAQGASGNLAAISEIRLRDSLLSSPLDNVHIILVPLDGQPINVSRRILLQVMTEERNTGWTTVPQGQLVWIEHIGKDPWQVRKIQGTVRLLRPDAPQLDVTALDLTGRPRGPIGHADSIALQPDTVYYLITAR
ncbi:MAG TPA: hypothetical protein PKM73_14305 [Verrucomicrobiota bacterium]|nr:hypothetical protein [Verrucomicrobiota bacterium]HNU51720.1 hypothetical protein [Verrucomicrobiota bacterium]